jgi:hypothetical protein
VRSVQHIGPTECDVWEWEWGSSAPVAVIVDDADLDNHPLVVGYRLKLAELGYLPSAFGDGGERADGADVPPK